MRVIGMLLAGALLSAAPQLAVLPGTVKLSNAEAKQQLLLEATVDGFHEDRSKAAQWTSSNPAVATVDAAGLVKPAGDGEAVITGKLADGSSAAVKVSVAGAKAPFAWSFRNHVIPVLTKASCNQGACHGALAGKNGFKLTLRGYDPEVDYDVLTRQAVGRRVSLADPPSSLLLQKATFGIPHGGGQRFKKDSLEYRVIQEWIAAGAAPPPAKEAEITGLEVFPAQAILRKGAEQQLVVRAKMSDGTFEDVTRWVKYSSNNEGVATVDDYGHVKTTGNGEAAITLWYNSKVLYARMTVPYEYDVPAEAYTKFTRNNYIDELVIKKLQALRLQPSPRSSDSAFIRRAYLDAAGILPTAEEVEQFLADQSPDKRAKVIDRLLERDEFTDYWAYKWSDLFLVSSRKLNPPAMTAFYNWIRESVKQNKPWDRMAKDIFTASGSSRENGALNYFVLHKNPIDLTENVTQAFLGQRLTCARCHNHPLEKWTQRQYYQMANLFARVGIKNGDEPGDVIVYAKNSGDVNHPRLLRPLAPTPLDGQPMDLASGDDRRIHFANWLTSPQNTFFARNLINRVWGNFMGRGLTDPIDDVRATNPASNEELFAALEKDFTKDFDVKRLVRTIMNSAAYQLSAESNGTNQNDNVFYSRYIIKRLPAEVLLDSLSQVTGAPSAFDGMPRGTRALQLPDVRIKSQFLDVFGRPARILCDAGERSADPSVAQALHVINGDTLNRKLTSKDGYIALLLRLGLSDSRVVEHLYLSAFSRYPTAQERQTLLAELAKTKPAKGTAEQLLDARRQALEDMAWALLTSKEFLFNH